MNLASVEAHLQRRLQGLIAIYLFGSQAKGDANAASDVDLAVLVAGYIEPLLCWELTGELSDLVNRPVDLVDLRRAGTVMQYQIVTTGRRLWSVASEADLYETFILGQKTELDTARAGLLNEIYQSGVIHGR